MSQRFYIETLGCPKNQVDSDKLVGTLLADGMAATDDAAARRPGRRQHLRVHRGRPPGVDRHRSWPRRARARTAPGSSSPAAWPSATATSWPRRCPRSTRSPASACRSRLAPATSPGSAQADPGVGARSRRSTCSTCRGRSRPRRGPTSRSPRAATASCGFCAIPSFRGPQRSRDVGVDPRRGRRSSRPARSCSSPRTSPPTARTARASSGAGSIVPLVEAVADARRPGPAALPLPERPHRRADRRRSARPACRTSTCRCSTCSKPLLRRMRRWGDGDRFLRPHRRHPRPRARRRVPQQLHRRLSRARPRPTTTSCSTSSRQAQLDWCGFFAYSREDGTYAADLDGAVDPTADGRAARRAARAAGRHHRARAATS